MREISPKGEHDSSEPNLTVQQMHLRNLCREVLALKPENKLNLVDVPVSTDPVELQEKLRKSSFGKLLLADGQSLSADPPNAYHFDLGLYVGDAKPQCAGIRVWDWKYENPIEDTKEEWAHALDIIIVYEKDKQKAWQKITATSTSKSPHIPRLSRDVFADAYREMGYEGHNQEILRLVSPENVDEFLQIATELFAERTGTAY